VRDAEPLEGLGGGGLFVAHAVEAGKDAERLLHAESLRQRTVDLVDGAGCFEYFSALTGEGHGAADFSWTAALAIDPTLVIA